MATSRCQMEIVRATPANAGRLSQIAHAAKSYWGYPARWIELWHNQLTVTPAFVEQNEVWNAVCEEQIQGFCSLSGSGETLVLDNLWIMPVCMRQGMGSRLFTHAMLRAAVRGARAVEIESDPNAEPFYQRMGAVTVGEVAYTLEDTRRSLPLMRFDTTHMLVVA